MRPLDQDLTKFLNDIMSFLRLLNRDSGTIDQKYVEMHARSVIKLLRLFSGVSNI